MLMRRVRAYSSSCSQVVLVYLYLFRRNRFYGEKLPKNHENPLFVVQGHSGSSMLTFLRSSLPVLIVISSMSVPICNQFYGKRADSSRITSL